MMTDRQTRDLARRFAAAMVPEHVVRRAQRTDLAINTDGTVQAEQLTGQVPARARWPLDPTQITAPEGTAYEDLAAFLADFADLLALLGVKFVVAEATAALAAEQSLGALSTGLLKNTVAAGVGTLSTAVPGTDYQAADAELTALAGLVSAADRLPYFTGAGAAALATFTAFARTLLDDANAAAALATIGAAAAAHTHAQADVTSLVSDLAGKQPLDTDLTAIAALVSAANKLPYATGAGTWALTDLTAFARTILDDASEAAFKATVNLEIGTDVQAFSAILADLAGLTQAGDRLPYFDSATTAALATFTAFARTLLDDADAATARTTLGAAATSHTHAQADVTNLTTDLAAKVAKAGDAMTGNLNLHSGVDLVLFSDAGSTATASWDGTTGKISQAEVATPATPSSGYAVLFPNTAGQYEAIDDNGDVWSLGHCQTVKKTADQTLTSSQTTLTDVSDLSFVLRPNTDYMFEFFLVHQSAASTTGLKLALVTGAATLNYLQYTTEIQVLNTANGTDNVEVQNHTASGSTHTAANQAAATTNSLAVIKGVVSVSGTGGTMRPRFAGDALANITIKKGSYGRLWI